MSEDAILGTKIGTRLYLIIGCVVLLQVAIAMADDRFHGMASDLGIEAVQDENPNVLFLTDFEERLAKIETTGAIEQSEPSSTADQQQTSAPASKTIKDEKYEGDTLSEDIRNLRVFADFRFRFEKDWDSHKDSGVKRDDRSRARVRVRLGLEYNPVSFLSFGIRARTGAEESQQSPHITIMDFNGNSTGDKDALLDKCYVKASNEHLWTWLGRNSFPFWKQNEFFWDDDVTPTGIAIGYKAPSPFQRIGDNSVARQPGLQYLDLKLEESDMGVPSGRPRLLEQHEKGCQPFGQHQLRLLCDRYKFSIYSSPTFSHRDAAH